MSLTFSFFNLNVFLKHLIAVVKAALQSKQLNMWL